MNLMMGTKRTQRNAAAGLATLLVALIAVPATAGPNDRLHEIQRKKAATAKKVERLESRTSQLSVKVGELDARRATVEGQVAALDSELAALEGEMKVIKDDLAAAQAKLAVLTEDLYKVLRKLDARVEAFKARAVAAYMAGPTAYVDTILSSESLSEMVDRQTYYESALNSDSALLEEIESLRAATDARRDLVQKKQREIVAAKEALESKQVRVARVREERGIVLAQREEVLASKQSVLVSVKDRESRAKAMLAQLKQDENTILAVIASQSSGGTAVNATGRFQWPANGPLTSSYGLRVHPIFGDTRMHTGIDIGATSGSAVLAADGGKVIYVGAMSGYGNVVVVDHGRGLATTYNHLSSFSVSTGQGVGKGATVGAVGCTGYCTGPHLHFEVRVNGSTVDPMPYFR